MYKETNKLTPAALVCLLLCARSFATLTFFPADMTNGTAYIVSVLLSTTIQGLILIPAAYLASTAKSDPCTLAIKKNALFGKIVTCGFMLYFLYEAFFDIGSMAFFTDFFFSVNMPRIVTVVCCTLAAVYAARLNTVVIGKTAQIAFAGVVLMLIIVASGAAEDMDFTRFNLAVPELPKVVGKSMLSETRRCECLVLFTFLSGQTQGDPRVTAKKFILVKATVISLIFTMVTAVMGNLTLRSSMPMFTLAASSENLITERSDAVFLLVWVFTGIVKIANLLHCAACCIRLLRPRTTALGSALAAGVIPAVATLPILMSYGWEKIVFSEHSLAAVILLAFVLPLLLLRSPAKNAEVAPA